MLSLAEKVGGTKLAVHCVVGDHQRLGGAGQQVEADAAEELALASATKALPGPTSMSTASMLPVPSAMAPTAWMPPST